MNILPELERQQRVNAAVSAMLSDDPALAEVAAFMLLSPEDHDLDEMEKMEILLELLHTCVWDIVKIVKLVAENMGDEDRESPTPMDLWAMLISEGLFNR